MFCVARTGERRDPYRVFVEKPEGERNHFEFLSVDVKIILKWKYYEDVEWIDVVHVTNKWRAFVNTVINIHVP